MQSFRAWRQRKTTKEVGDALEFRVARLFKRLGKWNVKRNLILKDRFGNISQIDVTYGFFFKTYIECKNYSSKVPLEDVAKFKQVLELNNIPASRGIFVTTNSYVPRARTIGIRTIDGDQLKVLEKNARIRPIFRRLLLLGVFSGLGVTVYLKRDDPDYWKRTYKLCKKKLEQYWQDLVK